MSEMIANYTEAQRKLAQTNDELKSLASMFMRVGRAILDNPGTFMFANANGGLPAEASTSRDSESAEVSEHQRLIRAKMQQPRRPLSSEMSQDGVSINALNWPSADQIMKLLARWRSERDAAKSAWGQIDPADRSFMKEPKL
ncbi:MAG: hypothetical protein HQL40_16215 [Alphaproteobacteria bacterium]|nr:hypothetical protein [Alphaproteobacteria bacterium]MBF0375548.1 hypothetical protein [Alphaproteobacteria bacterium]